jgi:hypothetical protein
MAMIEFVNVDIHIIAILTPMLICYQLGVNIVVVSFLCKAMKMKNPCKDCLVKPSCSELCFAKINYGTLLRLAIQAHREFFIKNGFSRKDSNINENQKDYEVKNMIHTADLIKIEKRRSRRL